MGSLGLNEGVIAPDRSVASFATLRAMRLLHAHSARLAAFHPVSATVIALQAARPTWRAN